MGCCAKCVMPNTIHSLSIGENGVCDACLTAEVKKEIDWVARSIQHGFSVSRRGYVGALWDSKNLDGKFIDIRDYLMYMKYGLGRATSQACIDIRHGRLTRDEAIELVDKCDGEVETVKGFRDYISITEKRFWEVVNSFIDKKASLDPLNS